MRGVIKEIALPGGRKGQQPTRFEDLKIGDVFKMYEPDGTAVVFKSQYLFIAASNPYKNMQGVWTIDIATETRAIRAEKV